MAFIVHIKDEVGNEISRFTQKTIKQFTVDDLVVADGLIFKGSYAIPVQSILFIEEI